MSSCNKVASEFFKTNAPNPPHWTPNSCFGALRTVLLPHELRCKTCQTGALVAKFVQRSRVRIFRNEHTRSTPFEPKLMFGAFRIVSLLHELRCKTCRTGRVMHQFVEQSRVGIFRNEHTRSTPFEPNSCLGAVLTVSLLHELWCKTGRTGAINALVHATKSRHNFSQ
jgi:hypothetical protein